MSVPKTSKILSLKESKGYGKSVEKDRLLDEAEFFSNIYLSMCNQFYYSSVSFAQEKTQGAFRIGKNYKIPKNMKLMKDDVGKKLNIMIPLKVDKKSKYVFGELIS